ncbi:MAG: D-sedoheptulose-7-phosphate isomerase [bacterium]
MNDSSILRSSITEALATFRTLSVLQPAMDDAAERVRRALLGGHKLLVCGNGGSAADAMHLATEFVCRFRSDRRPYPALCLNASGGDLTAIGNDYAYEEVFARQVAAFGRPDDVLLIFSTSGRSPNIVAALEQAGVIGMDRIAFLGQDGGDCHGLAEVELLIPATTITARVQEAQKLLMHVLCEMVEPALAGGRTDRPDYQTAS